MLRRALFTFLFLLYGCGQEPQTPDSGPSRADAGGADAMISPPPAGDAGQRPAADAGPDGEGDSGPPTGLCEGITCGANANCDAILGRCRCETGFEDRDGACEPVSPVDPADRTSAEVCERWISAHAALATPAWVEGTAACDPGVFSAEGIEHTLLRLNMYRWLAGLAPVSHQSDQHAAMMQCAHMSARNDSLSHSPPPSWECYSDEGAAASARSSLALTVRDPASAVDVYMRDRGIPSLGDRRRILGGGLPSVEIGFSEDAQCMGMLGSGGSTERAWVAYPNEGFAPLSTAQAAWSFHAEGLELQSGARATVLRVSDGQSLPVTSEQLGRGFGPVPTLSFTPMDWTPTVGETYRVTISGTSAGDITYETTLSDC